MSKNQPIPEGLSRQLDKGRAERALLVERQAIDEAARTATLAFASEAPYERYWGIEILDTTATSMRQGRLRSGANLLCDHNTTDVVGVVESVEIGADRVARAVVRFGKSARAEEVWQDVRDGIRRNVSVGYLIHKAQLIETKDGLETYRVTDWEPFEVSLVSVPADASVGVGRSFKASSENEAPASEQPANQPDKTQAIETKTLTPSLKEEKAMSEETTKPVASAPVITVTEQRNHAAEIAAIAKGIPGGAEVAMRAIQEQKTVEQFQQEMLRHMQSKPLATADIGMDKSELKRYSVMRAINAMANPNDHAARNAAAFEFECSGAMAQKMGRQAQGFFVPYDVLSEKRDLTVGSAASAGNFVDTTLATGSFIDMLRARMVLGGLGIRYLPGLVGDVDIPRQTGTASTYWLAEQGGPTKSDQATDKPNMSPKTVGAKTVISRKLRQQSSIDVDMFVRDDLNLALALEMESAIFNGSGAANNIRGLLNVVGIGSVLGGTNGAAPTWDHMVDLETAVSIANADIGNLAYVTNAKMRGKLKKTFVNGTGSVERVWQNGDTPLNGYKAPVTNLMPSNLTKGTASGTCSAILFGNFADVVVGMWGGLDLLVDPYTGGDAGDVSVRVLQDMDMIVRHPESFAAMKDALTA